MKPNSSWVERFYTHFLGRDLTYLFAGGLFIRVVKYALWAKSDLPQKLDLELVGFLFLSYFIGLTLSEFGGIIGIVKKRFDPPNPYKHTLLFKQDVVEHYNVFILNQLERTIFLMHVGASVGVSSLFGGVFMGILAILRFIRCILNYKHISFEYLGLTAEYLGLTVFLIVWGFCLVYHSRFKSKRIIEEREALAEDIQLKKQGNTNE